MLEDTLQLTPNRTGDVAKAVQLLPGATGDVINNITDKREFGSDYSEDERESGNDYSKDDNQIPSSERPVRGGRRTREFERRTWPPTRGGSLMFLEYLISFLKLWYLACPSGWEQFEDNCYRISEERLSWSEAATTCRGLEVRPSLEDILLSWIYIHKLKSPSSKIM